MYSLAHGANVFSPHGDGKQTSATAHIKDFLKKEFAKSTRF
jgi:hypothetical protein